MNFVRLSTISPELVALLSSKETTHLVRVSAATVDWVFKEVEVVDSRVTNDFDEGSPTPALAVDVCPNPDCPGADSDLAKAAQVT